MLAPCQLQQAGVILEEAAAAGRRRPPCTVYLPSFSPLTCVADPPPSLTPPTHIYLSPLTDNADNGGREQHWQLGKLREVSHG